GTKDLKDKIMVSLKEYDPLTIKVVEEQLSKLAGEAFIKNNVEQGFKILPDTIMYIGQQWNDTAVQTTDISFEARSHYKLTDIKDDIAEIEVRSDINGIPNIPAIGYEVTPDLKGEQEGYLIVNTQTGMCREGKNINR